VRTREPPLSWPWPDFDLLRNESNNPRVLIRSIHLNGYASRRIRNREWLLEVKHVPISENPERVKRDFFRTHRSTPWALINHSIILRPDSLAVFVNKDNLHFPRAKVPI